MLLFRDKTSSGNYTTNSLLKKETLQTEINRYKGTFVVFLEACCSGSYTSIVRTDAQKHKIKMLCSSKADQLSYGYNPLVMFYATYHWSTGSGLINQSSNQFGSMLADQYSGVGNNNNRISLRELYKYSYDKVLYNTQSFDPPQEVDCSNPYDMFNIFYTSLPSGY